MNLVLIQSGLDEEVNLPDQIEIKQKSRPNERLLRSGRDSNPRPPA
jgi:hypothetical protein